MFTVGLICGGPSAERGISLNSARSVLDHLQGSHISVRAFFVDIYLDFYAIATEQLYSNTPSDFDFKLSSVGSKLDTKMLQSTLLQCDMVLPVIHGSFGEDGRLAELFEQWGVPFVGNSSQASARAYQKDSAQLHLATNKMPTLPYFSIQRDNCQSKDLMDFWSTYVNDKAVLKPACGGSSIDVYVVDNTNTLFQHIQDMLDRHEIILLQPFYRGTELTITVLENPQGDLIALPATATKILGDEDSIFTYRAKYLPSYSTHNHTPAPLAVSHLKAVSSAVKKIFKLFGLRDCARFDGWYDEEQGFICNDINPMSGLEESSFFFKQAACCGLSHAAVLSLLLRRACIRQNITPPKSLINPSDRVNKTNIPVIFGGASTERQVSVMSGRNVWLKLMQSTTYQPIAFFLDRNQQIWELPYTLALHHTVEEIEADLESYQNISAPIRSYIHELGDQLGTFLPYRPFQKTLKPQTLSQFVGQCSSRFPFVFLALHGGIGEDGTIQKLLTQADISFNGSLSEASYLCMNKYATRTRLRDSNIPHVHCPKQFIWHVQNLSEKGIASVKSLWSDLCQETGYNGPFIIKPMRDGCSSGIVRLNCSKDLENYAQMLINAVDSIPANTFFDQPQPVEIDSDVAQLLIEPYILTDVIHIKEQQLSHQHVTGWLELTVVVSENNGIYKSLTPSITVSESAVLSVEEKFQGGTGINLTPPPAELVDPTDLTHIKDTITQVAQALGVQQYARIDLFFNTSTREILVIEANSLPALTPSTVLFQQALCEKPAYKPLAFLEKLISDRLVEVEAS